MSNAPEQSTSERIDVVVDHWRAHWPRLMDRVLRWPMSADRIPVALLASPPPEFELPSARGGRGDSYRQAQQDARTRATGINGILSRLGVATAGGGSGGLVLDVLGGDGLISRYCASIEPKLMECRVVVVSNDLAWSMVSACLGSGAPALWQPAEALFMVNDRSFDAAFLAYGTHHIPAERRLAAVGELCRVTRPGGRVLVHDFDRCSPMARWFSEIVHPYSELGHPHRHFTPEELCLLLSSAGAEEVFVEVVDDPIIVRGETADAAIRNFIRLLSSMYGLTRLDQLLGVGWTDADMMRVCQSYFVMDRFGEAERMTVERHLDGWMVTAPRAALVATGVRT